MTVNSEIISLTELGDVQIILHKQFSKKKNRTGEMAQ